MSLKSTLEKKEAKELFKNKLGNIKPLFKTDEGEAFPKGLEMKVRPVEGISNYSLGIVGTAYDFWFRSYLQRINKTKLDENEFRIVYEGLGFLKEDRVLNEKEYKKLIKEMDEVEKMRDLYSSGGEVELLDLIKGLLKATYCQNYYRARNYPRQNGYEIVDEYEIKDVLNLVKYTVENEPSFSKIKDVKNAKFNPNFGEASRMVDGADADMIIDGTLIDIKTTKDFGCQAKYYNQIIGYYLLERYQNKGISEIKKLGLYFSRQNKYVYLEIEELKEKTKIEELYEEFFEMVKKHSI